MVTYYEDFNRRDWTSKITVTNSWIQLDYKVVFDLRLNIPILNKITLNITLNNSIISSLIVMRIDKNLSKRLTR